MSLFKKNFEESEVKELFKKFDLNKDEAIDKVEFKKLVKEVLNLEPSPADLDKAFNEVDTDHDGKISIQELTAALVKK